MKFEQVTTAEAPPAIGPYSQGLRAGDFVFFSGQIPLRPDGTLVGGGIVEQAEQVMLNMAAMLKAADLGFSDVVKTTVYLTNLGDFSLVNEIYGRHFGQPAPARACVQVAALPRGVEIEIEWIACLQRS